MCTLVSPFLRGVHTECRERERERMHAPFARCLSSEGFGGFVPIVSLGKLSARVSRGRVKTVRVSRGRERERAGGRSKGDMQQVVRFSKPIEIDGFPIP